MYDQSNPAAVNMGVLLPAWSHTKPPVKHPAQEWTFPAGAGIVFSYSLQRSSHTNQTNTSNFSADYFARHFCMFVHCTCGFWAFGQYLKLKNQNNPCKHTLQGRHGIGTSPPSAGAAARAGSPKPKETLIPKNQDSLKHHRLQPRYTVQKQ